MSSDQGTVVLVGTTYLLSPESILNKRIPFNPFNAEATFIQRTRTQGILENGLNPVMLVLIRKLKLSTLR